METKQLNFNNLENALSDFTKEFVSNYKSLLLRDGKKASGNLISSLKPVSIQFTNNKIEADISIASYWKYVEYGRRPGKFPPVNKILDWIKVKPVIPRPMNGLKPGNQFEEALNMTWAAYEKTISDAISEDLNEMVDLVTFA